jgi:hypothetical protein
MAMPPQRRTILYDATALAGRPDATTIDALARLQLALRPLGLEILLHGASEELVELIGFVGLAGVLRVEPRRQPEERKEWSGIEEERELDDRSPRELEDL